MSENNAAATATTATNPDASDIGATGASTDLSTANQPAGTVCIENGRAFNVAGKDIGAANESAPAKIDYEALAKQYGSIGSEPTQPVLTASNVSPAATPAPIDYEALAKKYGSVGSEPTPQPVAQGSAQKDTGVVAGIKRNTVDALTGLWHAFNQPATDDEKAAILAKVREANANGDKVPEELATNPSRATLALHRLLDAPADQLLKKGRDEVGVAQDLIKNHQYWKGGNLYLSGLTDKVLSGIPLIGPTIGSIAERGEGALVPAINKKGEDIPVSDVPAERKDFPGAATDVGAALALENAPTIAKGAGKAVETADKLVGNAANKIRQAKVPALTDSEIVQRFIKRSDTPAAQHGTPVNVESPLDSATVGKQLGGKDLSQEALDTLKQHVGDNVPVGSTAKNRLTAAVEPVVQTINDTASKLNAVVQKAPNFTTSVMQDTVFGEGSLNDQFEALKKNLPASDRVKLSADADSVLEDADKALNSNDPSEVLEYRRQLGRKIDWDSIEKNPSTPSEVQNAARAKVYQQLTGKIHAEIPETVELDKTLQPNLELRSHLIRKVGERLVDDPHAATVEAQNEFKKGSQTIENQLHNERAVQYRKRFTQALLAGGILKLVGGKRALEILEALL
jgi:hypothetical protein